MQTFFPLFFASHSPNPHTVWVLKYSSQEGKKARERRRMRERGMTQEYVHAYDCVQETGMLKSEKKEEREMERA